MTDFDRVRSSLGNRACAHQAADIIPSPPMVSAAAISRLVSQSNPAGATGARPSDLRPVVAGRVPETMRKDTVSDIKTGPEAALHVSPLGRSGTVWRIWVAADDSLPPITISLGSRGWSLQDYFTVTEARVIAAALGEAANAAVAAAAAEVTE